MGDFNNPNENTEQQNNQDAGQQQIQQPQYDQNQNQQSNPNQQSDFNQQSDPNQQPQYQQPQYGGQSQYQQPQNQQYQQNPYQQNPYQQYAQYQQPQRKDNGMAIASLVCGIVSVVLGCCAWYITLPLSIVGLVLGIICLKNKKDGSTMAIIGIILSSLGIMLGILGIIGTIALRNGGTSFLNDFYSNYDWESSY